MRKVFTPELFPSPSRLDPSEIKNENVRKWAREVRRWARDLISVLKSSRQPPPIPVTVVIGIDYLYTVQPEDSVLLCNTDDPLSVLLPKSTDGKMFRIKNAGSGTLVIVGSTGGSTVDERIDGSAFLVLTALKSATLTGDGTNWWLI